MRWILIIGSDVIVYFQLCASIPYWGMIMSNPTMETKALPRLARSLPNPYWYSYNLLCVQSKSRHISKALNKTQRQKWNSNSLFQTWMAITKPAGIFFFASKSISMFHCDCFFFPQARNFHTSAMKDKDHKDTWQCGTFPFQSLLVGIGSVARFLKNSNL